MQMFADMWMKAIAAKIQFSQYWKHINCSVSDPYLEAIYKFTTYLQDMHTLGILS